MNDQEFRRWHAAHFARFTGLGSWLGKNFPTVKDARREFIPTQSEVIAGWARTLRDCEFDDAMQATNLICDGTEEQPKVPDDHPRIIRAVCKRLVAQRYADRRAAPIKSHYVDGKPTYKCLTCKDSGAVRVWMKCCVEAARNGALREMTLNPEAIHGPHTTAVRCTCDAGAKYQSFPLYDPTTWAAITSGESSERYRQLMDWLDENSGSLHGAVDWQTGEAL